MAELSPKARIDFICEFGCRCEALITSDFKNRFSKVCVRAVKFEIKNETVSDKTNKIFLIADLKVRKFKKSKGLRWNYNLRMKFWLEFLFVRLKSSARLSGY